MATRSYLNFDLLVEQETEGHFQARVTGSPVGDMPGVRFTLPFDASTLQILLLTLDPGRSGTRRKGASTPGRLQAVTGFGGPLFRAIFKDDLLLAWTRSLDVARQRDDSGLRLRLRLNDAPAIAGLPWELLYDERTKSFIAQSERTPVVRYLDIPQAPKAMAVDGPLHVLTIISSPMDLVELDVEAEWRLIGEALAPRIQAGLVVVDRLPKPTMEELGKWLRRNRTHVIHFVGHGEFGVLYFQDRHGHSSAVTSAILGPQVKDHDPLRMVVLNACRSARADAADPFGGMAQGLVQQDATAVVAMQFPISDRAAVTFTGEFYGAIVDGLPVDQAVTAARKSLLAEYGDEWATPVLFLRAPDGNIFANVHAREGGDDQDDPPAPPGLFARLVRDRRVWLLAVAALVVTVAGTVLLSREGDPGEDVRRPLPVSAGLTDSQLLVAAGDDPEHTDIWLVDRDDPGNNRRLTSAPRAELVPAAVPPDRRTVVYSQSVDEGRFILHAAAADGSEDRLLFPVIPDECIRSMSRPAWFLDDPEVVVIGCRDAADVSRLLRVRLDGTVERSYFVGRPRFGDPTLSPDGSTIMVWASKLAEASGGALYTVEVDTGVASPWLETQREQQFSDAVFSPDGTTVAFRQKMADGDYEVFTAPFDDPADQVNVSNWPDSWDQDPTFSPDGSEIAFKRTDLDGEGAQIYVVGLDGGEAVALPSVGAFVTTPAWSRR